MLYETIIAHYFLYVKSKPKLAQKI